MWNCLGIFWEFISNLPKYSVYVVVKLCRRHQQHEMGLNNFFFGLKKSKTTCTIHTEWFSWQQKPQRPQWPQQPQQPQWPQWPFQPHFIKKITELNVFINPGTKMTFWGLLMCVGMSKTSLFYWFLAPFLFEAVEDRDVTFNQIKGW